MPIFQFGTTALEYDLVKSKEQKDVSISLEWLEGLKVVAPESITTDQLQLILNKKAPWIIKKWYELNEIEGTPAPKEYVSGEKFLYLGRNYKLKVLEHEDVSKLDLYFKQGRFFATVPSTIQEADKKEGLNKLFKNWYLEHGQAKIEERLGLYSPIMGFQPQKLSLKEQKMRWGTCTPEGAIYLNWRITMAPVSVIDYVLVHELAHLKYPNHSPAFWNYVRSILPNFEELKEWLRINGPKLTIDY